MNKLPHIISIIFISLCTASLTAQSVQNYESLYGEWILRFMIHPGGTATFNEEPFEFIKFNTDSSFFLYALQGKFPDYTMHGNYYVENDTIYFKNITGKLEDEGIDTLNNFKMRFQFLKNGELKLYEDYRIKERKVQYGRLRKKYRRLSNEESLYFDELVRKL